MVYIGITDVLNNLNKSKYWFVKEMQCNYQSMSKLMNNEATGIKFETIEKICDILDCVPSDFIFLEQEDKMSKLLNKYNELKGKDSELLYIFRSGIFYVALNEDAKILNEKLNLKITSLSPEIIKCGFPISAIDKYIQIMNNSDIHYKIIDDLPKNMEMTDYLNNVEFKKIINAIKKVDMNNTTYKQAFDFLYNIQQKLNNIQ